VRLLSDSLYAIPPERQGNGEFENKTWAVLPKLSLTRDGVNRRQEFVQRRRMIPAVLTYNQRRNHEHPIAQCAPGVLQDFGFNLDLRPSCPELVQQALGPFGRQRGQIADM